VLWGQWPSGGPIPRTESPSTWLRIHTGKVIPGAKQTVSILEKYFLFSHYRTFHKMGLYYETMSNICPNVTEQKKIVNAYMV
jgi:hypothetical protein